VSRRRREKAIVSIISERTIRTQAELTDALRDRGIEASQSTVSRDIKRLGLVKIPADDGGYRYGHPEDPPAPRAASERLREAVNEFVTGTTIGETILALETPPGAASAVAAALDRAAPRGVAATLAGDDTVFILLRDADAAAELQLRIESWL